MRSPNKRVCTSSTPATPDWAAARSSMACTVSSSQARSTILLMESRKTDTAALQMNTQITTLAAGSSRGKPRRAPRMPAKLPTEESASERWCQASAIRAPERSFLAAARVYQYMISFTTMETTAAMRAKSPGMGAPSVPERITRTPETPMPTPVANSTAESSRAATHSMRSWP